MICFAGCGRAENPAESSTAFHAPSPRVPGSIEHALTPPNVVIAHGEELQLTGAQRSVIVEATDTTRTQLASLNTDLDRTTEALRVLLAATPIDEGAAMDAARAVSAVEDEIKFAHLRMLIRVQNTLTAEQRAQAQRYRTP
jgi:Spy/CpxP family protein refolding chaperone